MTIHADKTPQKSVMAAAHRQTRDANRSAPAFHQPETTTLSGLQRLADSNARHRQAYQLQALADGHTAALTGHAPIQRVAQVYIADWEPKRVVIESKGDASEYSGGDDAKNKGWNGVSKYRAYAKVGSNDTIDSGSINNDFRAAHAGHILANQNGGLGSDPDNVFAQDGGVNTGPYRSRFEIPMRDDLDAAGANDTVKLRVSLYAEKDGPDITQGPLEKESDRMDTSDEETDFEDF